MSMEWLAIFGWTSFVIDAFLWSATGYVLTVIVLGGDDGWPLGCGVSSLLFFVWDEMLTDKLMIDSGVGFTEGELAGISFSELFELEPADLFTTVIAAIIAFIVARKMVLGALRRIESEQASKRRSAKGGS